MASSLHFPIFSQSFLIRKVNTVSLLSRPFQPKRVVSPLSRAEQDDAPHTSTARAREDILLETQAYLSVTGLYSKDA